MGNFDPISQSCDRVRIVIFQGPVSQFQVPVHRYFFLTITIVTIVTAT